MLDTSEFKVKGESFDQKDWKAVQIHCHSKYGDGTKSVKQLLKIARKESLDAIAITDHNNINQINDPDFKSKDNLTVISGYEWGNVSKHTPGENEEYETSNLTGKAKRITRGPHAGILNIGNDTLIKASLEIDNLIEQVRHTKATIIINHPKLKGHNWPEDIPSEFIQAIEIWNSRFSVLPRRKTKTEDFEPIEPGNLAVHNYDALKWWDSLLKMGLRITAVAGSNFHRWPQRLSSPCILTYAPNNTLAEIMNSIRNGNVILVQKPEIKVFFKARENKNEHFYFNVGDSIKSSSNIYFTAILEKVKGSTLFIYTRDGLYQSLKIPSNNFIFEFKHASRKSEKDFIRLEVRASINSRIVRAITNPIYINY